MIEIQGGAIPSEDKSCPYGLRYRDGHCVPSPSAGDTTGQSRPEPERPEENKPRLRIPIKPVTVNVRVKPILRQRKYKTRNYKKTKDGRIKGKNSTLRKNPTIREAVVNLKPGDSVTTVGKGKREHIPSQLEKGKVQTVKKIRAAGKAASALAVLDVADTFFENLESGLSWLDAAAQIPEQYVDALVDAGKDIYDAVRDQDLVRLGVVSSDIADISTPVTRAIDIIGRNTGLGNIGSETVDKLRESMDIAPYSTEQTPEQFVEAMVHNWDVIGTPGNLMTTLAPAVASVATDIWEAMNNGTESGKTASPRMEHANKTRSKEKSGKPDPHRGRY